MIHLHELLFCFQGEAGSRKGDSNVGVGVGIGLIADEGDGVIVGRGDAIRPAVTVAVGVGATVAGNAGQAVPPAPTISVGTGPGVPDGAGVETASGSPTPAAATVSRSKETAPHAPRRALTVMRVRRRAAGLR
jgi:hypothetical protein